MIRWRFLVKTDVYDFKAIIQKLNNADFIGDHSSTEKPIRNVTNINELHKIKRKFTLIFRMERHR